MHDYKPKEILLLSSWSAHEIQHDYKLPIPMYEKKMWQGFLIRGKSSFFICIWILSYCQHWKIREFAPVVDAMILLVAQPLKQVMHLNWLYQCVGITHVVHFNCLYHCMGITHDKESCSVENLFCSQLNFIIAIIGRYSTLICNGCAWHDAKRMQ